MKTLIASLLITLTVSFTSFAQSTGSSLSPVTSGETQFSVVSLNSGKIDVTVLKSDTKKLVVQLVDKNGLVLASQSIKKQVMVTRTRFDLKELPDGVYHVELKEGTTTQIKDIKLNTLDAETIRTISLT